MLSRSPKDPRLVSTTSSILLLQMVGSMPSFRLSNSKNLEILTLPNPCLYYRCLFSPYVENRNRILSLGGGLSPHNTARVLQTPLLGMGLGNQIRWPQHTTMLFHISSSLYFIENTTRSLQDRPVSVHIFMLLRRVYTVGLLVPPPQKKYVLVSWNMQTHNTSFAFQWFVCFRNIYSVNKCSGILFHLQTQH
jgi:hypothetical protein